MLPRERMEVLQSLPGLVERARADSQKRGISHVPLQPPVAEQRDEQREKFRLVVDQYFQHADEWLAKGELEAAVKEIERVLLIEPGNLKAKKYREEIEAALRTMPPEEPEDGPASMGAPGPVVKEFGEETVPSAPAAEPVPFPPEPGAARAEKKRSALTVILVAVIAVAAIAVGVVTLVLPDRMVPSSPATEANLPPPDTQPLAAGPSATAAGSVAHSAQRDQVEEAPDVVPPTPVAERRNREPEPVRSEPKTIPVADSKPALQQARPANLAAKKSEAVSGAAAGFIAVQRDPKILKLASPVFPEADQYGDLTGEVIVKVQIDKNGKALQALVVSSTNNTLNRPVVDAVMRSSFEPAMMSKGPVVSWMTIPIRMK
jgi:TonB family protein